MLERYPHGDSPASVLVLAVAPRRDAHGGTGQQTTPPIVEWGRSAGYA
jgi:hypothetical protein